MPSPTSGFPEAGLTTDQVAAAIRACRYRYRDEDQLQEGIAAALDEAGMPALREARLTGRDRVDLLTGRIGVEVKLSGRPADVARQLRRYASSDLIDGLVLVTCTARHRSIPPEIGGKPVHLVHLSGAAT